MYKKFSSLLLLTLIFWQLSAQNGVDSAGFRQPLPYYPYGKKEKILEPLGSSVFKPTIGLGAGMFSFFGDLSNKTFQSPTTGRIGFDLTVSQPFNDYLKINFYVLWGKLGITEDKLIRNANFESSIRIGGFTVQYDFVNFIPKTKGIRPYIATGFESFEFLSKTDVYDKNGAKYFYWTDGSIKNISESSPNAPSAIELVRDYKYETDIRQLNVDGFGKYPERSFAIPVSGGLIFQLGNRVEFKAGTTMHFSFTDYIDGITNKSKNDRVGNKRNDYFMMTSFSLHYDLLGPMREPDTLPANWFDGVDFYALETGDADGDGVRDTSDLCPETPSGVLVNTKGCPGDDDGDGVPNHLDKELDTKPKASVDADGITLTDAMMKKQWELYSDTTGQFAEVISYFHGPYEKDGKRSRSSGGSLTPPGEEFIPSEYTILLYSSKTGLPTDVMSKFLSVKDIETTTQPDSAISYTAGHYTNYNEAVKRKNSFIKDGVPNAKVVYRKGDQFFEANSDIITELLKKRNATTKPAIIKGEGGTDNALVESTKGVVFRVQLGAYKKRLSKKLFPGLPDLVEVKTEDGLYKYMTGAYSTFSEAAKNKVDIVAKGYTGAFIAAYKDGQRVSLTSVGATPVKKQDKAEVDNTNDSNKPVNVFNKNLVTFKIQVGVFKGEPPTQISFKYKKVIEGVQSEPTEDGLTRYFVGSSNNYEEMVKLKGKMKTYGIDDAFVIAYFNGHYITAQEALELIK